MTFVSKTIFAFSLLSVPATLFAALQDIHTDKLPPDPSIQKAYTDAKELEPMTDVWYPNWKFTVSKKDVAKRLRQISATLQNAEKKNPDNVELHLLSGLVAHYGYNVDVDGSFETAMAGFAAAEKLAPADVRSVWFRAVHICQTTQPGAGITAFLELEKRDSAAELPPMFWRDYVECAFIVDMPAHVIRAGNQFVKLNGDPAVGPAVADRLHQVVDMARKRREAPDAQKDYDSGEAWRAIQGQPDPRFINDMCGISLSPAGGWRLPRLEVQKGMCVFQMETGPHRDAGIQVIPNILIMARPQKSGETLEQFAASLTGQEHPHAISVVHCPTDKCFALGAAKPGRYKPNGDGIMKMTFFARPAPQYPGLSIEEPIPIPSGSGWNKKGDVMVNYATPRKRYMRFEGTIFYGIMLDTASAVEKEATADYKKLLESVVVE